jgi:hypothetical protein
MVPARQMKRPVNVGRSKAVIQWDRDKDSARHRLVNHVARSRAATN